MENNTILSTILTVSTANLKAQQVLQKDHNETKNRTLDVLNEQKAINKSLDSIIATSKLTETQITNLKEILTVFVNDITNSDDMTVDDLHIQMDNKFNTLTRDLRDLVNESKPINYTEHITKLVESMVVLQKNISALSDQQKQSNNKMDELIKEIEDNKTLLSKNSSRINALDLRIASLIENGLTPVTDASLEQLISDLNIEV